LTWAAIGLATVVAAAAALAVVLRQRFVAVRIEGSSMEPTMRAGERVLVRRARIDRVGRGQVVVLAFPSDAFSDIGNPPWLIKRVAALPGDPVPREAVPALRHATDPHVPAGCLVLLGDNAAGSYDSRKAGYFSSDTLLGIVVRTLRA
jgi:signal peptidase I